MIAYEDSELVIVDKPAGWLSHRVWRNSKREPDCASWLKERMGTDLHPLHRLDRDSSGLLIFSRSSRLTSQLKQNWKEVKKKYLVAVSRKDSGKLNPSGIIKIPLRNRKGRLQSAQTEMSRISDFENLTLLEVTLGTGRKHQIRRHFKLQGHPVLGDSRYEGQPFSELCLCCHSLEFQNPISRENISIQLSIEQIKDRWINNRDRAFQACLSDSLNEASSSLERSL